MPLTAKDFKIYNSTPQFAKQLDQAFDYFRAKFPDGADAALQYLHDNNKAFMNNGPGNPYVDKLDVGADLYGHYDGHDVILWNPATGIGELIKAYGSSVTARYGALVNRERTSASHYYRNNSSVARHQRNSGASGRMGGRQRQTCKEMYQFFHPSILLCGATHAARNAR